MFDRRRFLAASAGLSAGAVLGCRRGSNAPISHEHSSASDGESPASNDHTTFYGDTFDAFATALYGELRKTPGNVFISPYSISTALAMTAEGARANTLSQMQKVLGLPKDTGVCDALAKNATQVSLGKDRGYELATANALWPQTGYAWSQEYLKRVAETFQASVTDVDYSHPEAARKTINAWVEKQTHDKIKELLAAGTIDTLTRLVLTNAIYFKGDWLVAFKKNQTHEAPFTMLDGTKKNVPLMRRAGEVDYFEDDQRQIIRLPYKGKEISFIAVLPKKPDAFALLDSDFNAESLAKWCKSLKPTKEVNVLLPRFKIEAEFRLNESLKELGMIDAFNDGVADFRGMTSQERLHISLVQHKTHLDVNEEGTEAAAATAVVVAARSARITPIFRADRPFLFALRHEPTGTLLFLGRYATP